MLFHTLVIEFARSGHQLLANSMGAWNLRDSLLLLSEDNGKTFIDYTSPYFLEYGNNYLFRLVQNPLNPNSVLIKTSHNGIVQSKDFGRNWKSLNPIALGYNVAFASYHPLDTTTIFYSGESELFSGQIYSSYDNGQNWVRYEIPNGDNCVHHIDFHPTNPDILIMGGEGVIGKSVDKGRTWNIKWFENPGLYIYKVIFDKEDPNILYASGTTNDNIKNHTIYLYRSLDMGESWTIAYKEDLNTDHGGVIDMVKYKNRLFIYTRHCGLLELDLDTTPMNIEKQTSPSEISISLNPVHNILYFDTDIDVSCIEMLSTTGHVLQKSSITNHTKMIDISDLINGVYLAVFYSKDQKFVRKIGINK